MAEKSDGSEKKVLITTFIDNGKDKLECSEDRPRPKIPKPQSLLTQQKKED